MNFKQLFFVFAILLVAIFGQADAKFKDKLKSGAKKALDVASKAAPIVAAGAAIARG
uniref:Salivary expressed cecropin n=1 Tax=Simulium vittatum TaxID=7192 RepID=B5M0S9_SIMVI|nr:salivary expressed cecropin precursor [Simulium vittatum]